ncbi:MAG TPA: fumarylacetoacetate hydrolase family protein [Clostridiaceae bacterium]|nr:fumarylacetoacetate hydrolase family protein [Clostridiaceae bacterium]
MKYLRFKYNGTTRYGILEGDIIKEISGNFFEEFGYTGREFELDEVKLLAPCIPSKVVAVGLNYISHIKEFGDRKIPSNPTLFIKLPHTIIGPGDDIIRPKGAERVDFEAELAVVISKPCKNISADKADDYILGATCLNDVTERSIQAMDGQWTRAKNFETFCPIGPYIVNDIDYNALDIKSYLNGEIKQSSNTNNLIWKVQELVSFISRVIPLKPGDIVSTGTPSGVGAMKNGDIIEIDIEGIGRLRNQVREE